MAKAFRIATLVSTLLLACSLALFIAGWHVDAYNHSIHVRDDFHIGLVHRDFDTGIAFFSDEFGPYNGGVIALTAKGDPSPFEKKLGFDAWGIYYRYFKFRIVDPGRVLWTLRISLWYPIAVFSILPSIWLARKYRRHANQPESDPSN